MNNSQKVTAIILTAGNSLRFGKNRNKNFEIVNGKCVLEYSLGVFEKNEYIDDIIITCKETEKDMIESIIEKAKASKSINIVIGGSTRKESVYNSLKSTDSDIVIIHDGARPLIKSEYIDYCVREMDNFDGVTVGVKTKDTIKVTDENNIVRETTKRNNTWIIQTPQCFRRKILLEMHERYKDEDVTDDCMLLEKGDYKVKIIEGDYTNIKITTYEDLFVVSEFLKNMNDNEK